MYQVDRDIRAFEFQHMNYVFHQMSSVHSYLPQFLISFHRVDDYADMQAYIARLEHLGQAISFVTLTTRTQTVPIVRPCVAPTLLPGRMPPCAPRPARHPSPATPLPPYSSHPPPRIASHKY